MEKLLNLLDSVKEGKTIKKDKKEGFTTLDLEQKKNINYILSLIIVQFLVLFFGKYLWNKFLVPAVSFVRPIETIWQIWAIYILHKLFF